MFLFHLLIHLHSTNAFYLWLTDASEKAERKRNYLSLSSFFFLCHHFQSQQLAAIEKWLMSKKGQDRLLWSLCLLKCLVWGKAGFSRGQHPCWWSIAGITHLPGTCTVFESHLTLTHCGLTLNSILRGHQENYMRIVWQRTEDMHITNVSSAYSQAPVFHQTCLQNINLEIKILRISRQW